MALIAGAPCIADNVIISALVHCEPEPLLAHSSSALGDRLKTVGVLSELVDRELVATISWAKQIPGGCCTTLSGCSAASQKCLLSQHQSASVQKLSFFDGERRGVARRTLRATWPACGYQYLLGN